MTMTAEEAEAATTPLAQVEYAEPAEADFAPNVIQAIARVIRDMRPVPKAREMTEGPRYNYRGIEDVTSAIQHLMGVHCVVPTSRTLSRSVEQIQKGGKPWTREVLEVVFVLRGPGGVDDCVETGPFYGIGEDNADKGTNKAETQAFKQMLLQTFVVGDQSADPDSYASESRDATTSGPAPAGVEMTDDEKAQRDGWNDAAARADASKAVLADLKTVVDAGKITREQANKAWKDYNEPDGKPADRTAASHRAWYQEVIVPLDPKASAPSAAPESTETPATTAGPPTQPSPAEEPKGRVDKADIPDNGYRDHLEDIYKAQGPDEVESFVFQMESADVSRALVARGADGMGQGKTLRNRLAKIVNARAEHDVMTSSDDDDEPEWSEEPF